ncbi:MAG: hypothetical protein PHR92_08000 [Lachnospiraceae bacterium]|nr:hypothetical protein [Lachnospiraceae bacterium]
MADERNLIKTGSRLLLSNQGGSGRVPALALQGKLLKINIITKTKNKFRKMIPTKNKKNKESGEEEA